MSRSFKVCVILFAVGGMTAPGTTGTSQAQWVERPPEGGVRVRAPFVRVDVDPYGGVSVRAPFTAIDRPGRRFREARPPRLVEPRFVEPGWFTEQELAAMDDESLRQTLLFTADRLHERLERFDTGDTWQRYLMLPEEAIDDSLPPDERREALLTLLERFHYVQSEPQYAMIARLPELAAFEDVLIEKVVRLDESAAAREPHEELPPPQPERPPRDGPFLTPAQ